MAAIQATLKADRYMLCEQQNLSSEGFIRFYNVSTHMVCPCIADDEAAWISPSKLVIQSSIQLRDVVPSHPP